MVHEATLINYPTIFATIMVIFPFHLPQMATFAIYISCSTSRLRHPPCTMHATTSPLPHTHTHTLGKVCVGPAAFQRRHQSIPHMPAVAPLATTWCPPVLLLANKHQWCCTASRVHREAASLRLCPHPPPCAAAPPECIKCRLQPLPRSHLSPASICYSMHGVAAWIRMCAIAEIPTFTATDARGPDDRRPAGRSTQVLSGAAVMSSTARSPGACGGKTTSAFAAV